LNFSCDQLYREAICKQFVSLSLSLSLPLPLSLSLLAYIIIIRERLKYDVAFICETDPIAVETTETDLLSRGKYQLQNNPGFSIFKTGRASPKTGEPIGAGPIRNNCKGLACRSFGKS